MAIVGRLAGAIILKTDRSLYMIGDRKEPLDWDAHGLVPLADRDLVKQPSVRLELREAGLKLESPCLLIRDEAEDLLTEKLVERFIIFRNGSVSERLWSIVTESSERSREDPQYIDANWLMETPADVWEIVRDSVLRC